MNVIDALLVAVVALGTIGVAASTMHTATKAQTNGSVAQWNLSYGQGLQKEAAVKWQLQSGVLRVICGTSTTSLSNQQSADVSATCTPAVLKSDGVLPSNFPNQPPVGFASPRVFVKNQNGTMASILMTEPTAVPAAQADPYLLAMQSAASTGNLVSLTSDGTFTARQTALQGAAADYGDSALPGQDHVYLGWFGFYRPPVYFPSLKLTTSGNYNVQVPTGASSVTITASGGAGGQALFYNGIMAGFAASQYSQYPLYYEESLAQPTFMGWDGMTETIPIYSSLSAAISAGYAFQPTGNSVAGNIASPYNFCDGNDSSGLQCSLLLGNPPNHWVPASLKESCPPDSLTCSEILTTYVNGGYIGQVFKFTFNRVGGSFSPDGGSNYDGGGLINPDPISGLDGQTYSAYSLGNFSIRNKFGNTISCLYTGASPNNYSCNGYPTAVSSTSNSSGVFISFPYRDPRSYDTTDTYSGIFSPSGSGSGTYNSGYGSNWSWSGTGSVKTTTVPIIVGKITITPDQQGGNGTLVTATFPVSKGENLYAHVGAAGVGTDGGGASMVCAGDCSAQSNVLAVAAGGGGGGMTCNPSCSLLPGQTTGPSTSFGLVSQLVYSDDVSTYYNYPGITALNFVGGNGEGYSAGGQNFLAKSSNTVNQASIATSGQAGGSYVNTSLAATQAISPGGGSANTPPAGVCTWMEWNQANPYAIQGSGGLAYEFGYLRTSQYLAGCGYMTAAQAGVANTSLPSGSVAPQQADGFVMLQFK